MDDDFTFYEVTDEHGTHVCWIADIGERVVYLFPCGFTHVEDVADYVLEGV